jgi:hypothetical protein
MKLVSFLFNWLLYSFYCQRRTINKGFNLTAAYAPVLSLTMYGGVSIMFIFNIFSPLLIISYCVIMLLLIYYTTYHKARYTVYFKSWIKKRYYPVKFANFMINLSMLLWIIAFIAMYYWFFQKMHHDRFPNY